MIRIVFYLFLALFMFGCGAKKMDFELIKNSEETDVRWWRAYKNEALNQSLDEYFSKDYELKNKALMLEYIDIENSLLRNYSFSTSLKADISKSLKADHSSKSFGVNAGVGYNLDLLGKQADKKRAKVLEKMALLDDISSLKQQNAYKIINILLSRQYLVKYQQLLIAKMQNLSKIYELAKYEKDLGKISSSELLEDKSKLDSAKISVVYNQLEIKKLNDSLESLEFSYDSDDVFIDDDEFLNYLNSTTINKSMILKRFDVLSKNKKTEIKNISYLISQKDMYFDIKLNAFFSSSSSRAKSMFDFGVLGGGVGIDFGVLDYANVKDRIKLSKLDYMMAKNEYENYIKTTFLTMKNLVENYQFYQKLMAVNDDILSSSQKDFDDNKYKYELKMISKKDFLRYENSLLDAKISHLKAQNELDKAKNDILNAFSF